LKKSNLKIILFLQTAVVLYSCSGIAGKFASRFPFLSFGFIACYALEILALGIYAIVWQQIIQKTELSVAYTNKAMAIFWSMLWSFLIFKEKISLNNIAGVLLIFAGILLVNRNA
jgi:drug/metabolite transporter (DMT)-like permease